MYASHYEVQTFHQENFLLLSKRALYSGGDCTICQETSGTSFDCTDTSLIRNYLDPV